MDRRTVLRGAAWSVPVIAAAVSVPLAAASTNPQQVVLTNKTAGIGGKPNTVFVNYKAKATEGPASTGPVTIVVTGTRDGQTVFEDTRTWPMLAGWGVTEYVGLEFPGISKGSPVTVAVIVTCDGAYQDGFTQVVETPGWWA